MCKIIHIRAGFIQRPPTISFSCRRLRRIRWLLRVPCVKSMAVSIYIWRFFYSIYWLQQETQSCPDNLYQIVPKYRTKRKEFVLLIGNGSGDVWSVIKWFNTMIEEGKNETWKPFAIFRNLIKNERDLLLLLQCIFSHNPCYLGHPKDKQNIKKSFNGYQITLEKYKRFVVKVIDLKALDLS
eukprot:555057_1